MGFARGVLPTLVMETSRGCLTKAQVRSLARAKITWVQPGIESLSDRTLELMRKGVTKLQNIQLSKWSAEVGIHMGLKHSFCVPNEDEGDRRRPRRVP